MKTIHVQQGTPEWLQHRASHFNASDAPAMLGISQYKSRSQLLQEYATGIIAEVDESTQLRFDDGHRFEALARPLAEKIIGDGLFTVVGTEGKLSASFDGITFDETVIFEHKTLNDGLRTMKSMDDLSDMYLAQIEQQLMVSNAEKCLFMASSWDGNDSLVEESHIWVISNQSMRNRIIQGWTQFAIDMENYKHIEVVPAAVAAPTRDLPALSIQVNGSISLIDNLSVFGERLKTFVAEIDMNPIDDQGFVNAEAAVKTLQAAQDALEQAEASALAQTSSIDEMRKTVKLYADTARTTRLMLEKMVKARKESIRIEIVQEAKNTFSEFVAALNKQIGKPYLVVLVPDFAGAIKGKKTITSLHEAVNNLMVQSKITANDAAGKIIINLQSLRDLASPYMMLFPDTSQIVLKANDDLVALIKMRIAEHKESEARKEAEMRAKVEAEAAAKLERERIKMQAEEEAKAKSAQDALLAEERIKMQKETKARWDLEQSAREIAQTEQRAKVEVIAKEQSAPKVNKQIRPSDNELIEFIAQNFEVSFGTARDWVAETANRLCEI